MKGLLHGHTDHVNTVKFFPNPAKQLPIILSGSVDKTIRAWQTQSESSDDFEPCAILEDHAGSVNCLAVWKGSDLIASGSADATVKIWRLRVAEYTLAVELIQTIALKPRLFPLALSLHGLDTEGLFVLAVAGTASVVHIYVASEDAIFRQQAILTGHEGWIRSVAFTRETSASDADLVLASASQDKYIRLWRLTKSEHQSRHEEGHLVKAINQSLSNKSHKLVVSYCSYDITFEALLLGHEDWIYTIAWRLDKERLQLLSASADNSLAIWQSEESSGVWVCTTRLGEISSQKGSTTATGSTGGFWIGLWSPSGENLLSLGKTGGWRLWNYEPDKTRWIQGIGVSGHTKAVTDLAWAKDGSYVLSTSSDQTTRLHAAWKTTNAPSWHEMARPQIHGYNLNCIDSIDQTRFVSGADEKLLRVFDEPRAIAGLLNRLCGIHNAIEEQLPDAADIPVLGLSNKAIENAEEDLPLNEHDSVKSPARERPDAQVQLLNLAHPPFEDQLARHTLWPEKEKLYGHGYEISAVAASRDGRLIATSCKASSIEHSVIRLYTTQEWREIKPSLMAHSLTVTALYFAGDDEYLLSVGRDRQWAVFERSLHSPESYFLKFSNPKGHSRMILNGAWAPLGAGRVFATAGRDKTIKVWKINETAFECTATISLSSAVTALDICPNIAQDGLVFASGTEVGEVFLHVVHVSDWSIRHTCRLERS